MNHLKTWRVHFVDERYVRADIRARTAAQATRIAEHAWIEGSPLIDFEEYDGLAFTDAHADEVHS